MTLPATMKAWQYSSLPGKLEDAISVNEAAPVPRISHPDQLLVEVLSTSINPVDYKLPESGIVGRLMIPRPATPGLDFCGRVVGRHPANSTFEEGTLVFGGFTTAPSLGTLGQYTVVPMKYCARLPEGVSFDDAAAAGKAAAAAYQSLTCHTSLKGAKLFVNGGSGGVGTWTIQLAKVMEVESVATSCSSENIALCQRMGADKVIDYNKVNVVSELRSESQAFDLVIDNVGGESGDKLYASRDQFLQPGGAFVQVGVGKGLSAGGLLCMSMKQNWLFSLCGKPAFYFINQIDSPHDTFEKVGAWMAHGNLKPEIDSLFSWEEAPQAFSKLRDGHSKGRIVVRGARSSSTGQLGDGEAEVP